MMKSVKGTNHCYVSNIDKFIIFPTGWKPGSLAKGVGRLREFWIYGLLLCIIGSMPLITAGINFAKSRYKLLSIFLFIVSALSIILAVIPIFQKYISSIIIFLIILNLCVSIFKYVNKRQLINKEE